MTNKKEIDFEKPLPKEMVIAIFEAAGYSYVYHSARGKLMLWREDESVSFPYNAEKTTITDVMNFIKNEYYNIGVEFGKNFIRNEMKNILNIK